MRIAVDARPTLDRQAGIGRYTFELLLQFIHRNKTDEFFLAGIKAGLQHINRTNVSDGGALDKFIHQRATRLVPLPNRIVRILTYAYTQYFELRRRKIDVVLCTNFFGFFGSSFKTVITIHDLAYRHSREFVTPFMYWALTARLYNHAHRADAIIAVSESTKDDIIRFLDVPKEKIFVIYPGVNPKFKPIHDAIALDRVRQKYGIPEKSILFVGTLEPRKNVLGLLRSFSQLVDDKRFDHSLVIVGQKSWKYREILRETKSLALRDRVVFTGYVDDSDLPFVYNLAEVLVLPSFYEGFGFPALEAMACGIPVIASNVSALPEVTGGAAIYVNPFTVDELATSTYQLLCDPDLRHRLRRVGLERASQFSWNKCAKQTLALLSVIVGND